MRERGGWPAIVVLAIAAGCGVRPLDPVDPVDAGTDHTTIGSPSLDAGQPSGDGPPGPCPVTQAPEGRFGFLSAGNDGTCGLQSDGTLTCWGFFWAYPQPIFTDKYKYVSRHLSICALHPRGEIGCWGEPGSLGAPPAGAFDYVAIGESAGCALASTGTVTCWGGAGYAPTEYQFASLAGGAYYMCALDRFQHAVCWEPRVGAETVLVEPGTFLAIATGRFFACGLRPDRGVSCWSTTPMFPDAEILGQSPPDGPFTEISAGDMHVCGLRSGGEVVCWGGNSHGQASPPDGLLLQRVSAGSSHTCGIQLDGTVVCWGGSSACGN